MIGLRRAPTNAVSMIAAVWMTPASIALAQDQTQPAVLPSGLVFQQKTHIGKVTPTKMEITDLKQIQHGTYETYPYYMIVETDGGPMLVSDGQLRAAMTLVPGSAGTRPRSDGSQMFLTAQYTLDVNRTSGQALPNDAKPVLTVNDAACGDVACFTISGTGDFAELPSGSDQFTAYLQATPRPDETSKNVTPWGNVFVPQRNEPRYYMFICWDVTKLKYLDYQETGCNKAVLGLPAPGSRNYEKPRGDMALPWGWILDQEVDASGASTTTTIASSSDVMNSLQRTTGYNVSGEVDASYGVVSASASFSYNSSAGQMQKFQNMHATNTIFTQAQFHSTEFAIVVQKVDATLDPQFRADVLSMLPELANDTLTDQVLLDFIDNYGTHYAYAVTYGTQGSATTTYTEDEVSSLVEQGANYSKAWEASVSVKVLGSGGKISGGSTDEGAQDQEQKFASSTSRESTVYICSGGASCDGGTPSGDPKVPVFLDLRPLSDLLAPPFFKDPNVVINLRDRLQKAIADYAFVELPSGTPDLAIGSLSMGSPLCGRVTCAELFETSITWPETSITAAEPAVLVPGANGSFNQGEAGGIVFNMDLSADIATILPKGPSATLGGTFGMSYVDKGAREAGFDNASKTVNKELVPLNVPIKADTQANLVSAELIRDLGVPGELVGFPEKIDKPITFPVTISPPDYSALLGTDQ